MPGRPSDKQSVWTLQYLHELISKKFGVRRRCTPPWAAMHLTVVGPFTGQWSATPPERTNFIGKFLCQAEQLQIIPVSGLLAEGKREKG